MLRPLVVALAAGLLAVPLAASASTASGTHGAVATDQHLASEVGLEVLRTGGNAVDAAVAIGYTLAVTYPSAGNLGGGGFMLVHMADGATHFIDFRETAPAGASAAMYQDAAGHVIPERSTVGALAVAVPGTVAGLEYAREHYGTRPRHDLMRPAITYADEGFRLDANDAAVFARGTALLANFSKSRAIFTRNGMPLRAGDTLRQPQLAATLRAIDEDGADAFYQGATGKQLANAVLADGGLLSSEDLANYAVKLREPVECEHHGEHVIAAPPPSSGGVAICEVLGILGDAPSAAFRGVDDAHLEIEAERRAFADRAALGDPDFITPPIARLLDPAYLARERASIARARATPSSKIHGTALHEGTNTTNYSVVDRAGDAVDVTYTLNSTFGSGMVAGDTGVLLNDEMDDFTSASSVPNQFGLIQGAANAIAPGKRPLSSMVPTILTDPNGKVRLVAGAAGGPRIITTTLDLVREIVDFGIDPGVAIDAPRVHEQWLPDVVYAEPNAFTDATLAQLRAMRYTLAIEPAGSAANAIIVRPDGTRIAAHDDRRPTGSALAY
ncbi:MAG TPA: gamma-glutamyltransferase [Candidatus Acidoferrum sp.]|nr:gamma-glutamyltransferase [Candidatus Acidoferrum sp.]